MYELSQRQKAYLDKHIPLVTFNLYESDQHITVGEWTLLKDGIKQRDYIRYNWLSIVYLFDATDIKTLTITGFDYARGHYGACHLRRYGLNASYKTVKGGFETITVTR